MRIQLYSELFEHSAFPVFVISSYGHILYKNPAANKYLPRLRKNADIGKYLQPPGIPEKSGVIQIKGSTVYHTGLALMDEFHILILCFSRLQCSDGIKIAEDWLEHFGDTAFDFICEMQKEVRNQIQPQDHSKKPNRLYTDMMTCMQYGDVLSESPTYDFIRVTESIFQKSEVSFSALGYRISTQISEDLPDQKEVKISFYDFLFLFGKLLYLHMRLAVRGEVSITLTHDKDAYRIRFLIRTEMVLHPTDNVLSFFTAHVPECSSEIILMQRLGLFEEDTIRFEKDHTGRFMTEYRIPYVEKDCHILRSRDISAFSFAEDIHLLIERIRQRLKDNGAFY